MRCGYWAFSRPVRNHPRCGSAVVIGELVWDAIHWLCSFVRVGWEKAGAVFAACVVTKLTSQLCGLSRASRVHHGR